MTRAAIFSFVLMLSTDFAHTGTVVAPAPIRQKTVFVSKPDKPNPALEALCNGLSGIGKGFGNVTAGTAKGAGWFFGELLRPVQGLRDGMIDAFGVKENARGK